MLDLVREIFAGLKNVPSSLILDFVLGFAWLLSLLVFSALFARDKSEKSFSLFLRPENVEELFEAIARDLFLMSKVGEAVKQTLNRLIESF